MIATGTPIGSFGTFITPRLATGGAISALQDVDILVAAGVTCIVDCRAEFNDGQLLASRPGVAYLWNPTADDGQHKDATWFDRSLRFCLPYLAQPGQRAYLHCAAGVNRGPSTALAVLMALGWTQDAAFALIKQARPIVNIAYAADAAAAISALGYA